MNRSQLLYLAASILIFFSACKKDEGLTEDQKASYLKYYGAASTGSDMAPTEDGGFIMVGTTSSGSNNDVILIKTDANGNQQWIKTFDGPGNLDDEGNAVVVTPTGGYAIIGNTKETITDSTSGFEVTVQKGMLLLTDRYGELLTSPRIYGLRDTTYLNDVYANGISMDNSGSNFILACEINHRVTNDKIGYGLLISSADYSQNGVIYCFIRDDNNDIINIGFKDVIQASNDHYIFIGNSDFVQFKGVQDKSNIWITDYLTMNNVDTSGVGNYYVFGGLEDDEAYTVIENSAGHYMISGYITQDITGRSDMDATLIECKAPTSDGPEWQSNFGEELSSSYSEDMAYSCFALSDGYIVAGMSQKPGAEGQLYMAKINSTGEKVWTKTYGYIGMDEARSVCETSDGGFALFGTATDERGNSTMCLLKTNSSGELK
ncbi:MAG TPA: hypothetical protein DCX54_02250 [Flavobacteriales bacterium]|nr:hypothetical protein [Flavobacteriales bacterium]